MPKRTLFAAAAFAFFAPLAFAGSAHYSVTADAQDRRLVRVEARITSDEDVILMYPDGASHVPEGWATYLRNLTSDRKLEAAGPGQWRNPAKGAPLHLKYEVLLHHDAGHWPFGWDEAAYVKGTAVFMTGKALFITALDVVKPEVEFKLPPKWQLVTAWPKIGDRYVPADAIELTESALLTGRFESRTVTSGDITVLLGMGSQMKAAVPLFEELIGAVLPRAGAIFGGTPKGTFAVIANREEEFTGGGTFVRSVSMLFQDEPTTKNRAEWAHVVVHELVHLWLGGAIQSDEAWFSEGFTDYVANLIELRGGIITEGEFRTRIAEHHKKYSALAGKVSLQAADKATHYDLVYSGGLLFARALDMELKARNKSLEDVLRALYAAQQPVTTKSLIATSSRVAGTDLAPLFARYVTGTEVLPAGN